MASSDESDDDGPEEVTTNTRAAAGESDDDEAPEEATSNKRASEGAEEDAPRRRGRARPTGSQRRVEAAMRKRLKVEEPAEPEAAEDFIALASKAEAVAAAPERKQVTKNIFVQSSKKPQSLFDSKPSQSALDLQKRMLSSKPRR